MEGAGIRLQQLEEELQLQLREIQVCIREAREAREVMEARAREERVWEERIRRGGVREGRPREERAWEEREERAHRLRAVRLAFPGLNTGEQEVAHLCSVHSN